MNFMKATGVAGCLAMSASALAGRGGEPDYPFRSAYRCVSKDSEATLEIRFLAAVDQAYGRAASIGGNLHKQIGFIAYEVEPFGESTTDSLTYVFAVKERGQAQVDLSVSINRAIGTLFIGKLAGTWDGEAIDQPLICRLATQKT